MVIPDTAHEPIAAQLLADLRITCAAARRETPDARLLAVWDFDGTLLHGDCSEGLHRGGCVVYPGLVQLAIEGGLATDYSAADGFAACWRDYRWLETQIGPWLALPFFAQIFAGAREAALAHMAAAYFTELLQAHYFAAAREIFDGLAEEGVEQHIISASAEVFVRGAAGTLGLPPNQIHGIRVRTDNGVLTRELQPPVTWAEGKKACLASIVGKSTFEAPLYVVAAFGDSYAADGPMLAHVAAQRIPDSHPTVVMINAGRAPPVYHGLFQSVQMTRTLGRD